MHSIPVLQILEKLGIIIEGESRDVFDILEKTGIVNENDIADKLGIRINDVRKALYKLGQHGFVTYTKEKDEEKKWWYVYNWQLDKAKIHYKYVQHLRSILHQKEQQLADENTYAFQCRKCKRKYEYQDALESGFLCKECAGLVREVTNSRVISQLAKDIVELLDVVRVEEELARKHNVEQKAARDKLHEKEAEAEAKAKQKKLAEARAKRAVIREAAKKLAAKNAPKKKPAKKVAKKKKPAKKKIVKKKIIIKRKVTKKPAKRVPTKKRVKKAAPKKKLPKKRR